MRFALVQTNPVVGDVIGNTGQIIAGINRAREAGADLAVFPELAVAGYPPRDLLLKPRFVQANVEAVGRIAAVCRGIAALVGFVSPNDEPEGRQLRNAAAFCVEGVVRSIACKSLLPTYDVFDEHRYFEPGPEVVVVEHLGRRIGVSICEDLWNDAQVVGRRLYHRDPVAQLAAAGVDVLVNVSASPFWQDKHPFRLRLFGRQAERHRVAILFCNQVGGNDDLVFDGASAAFDASGRLIAQARAFEEDLLTVDLPADAPGRIEPYPGEIDSVFRALVLGTRDYVRKCGFGEVVLGLSGGIDSAVTAAIAAEALGREAVTGVAMPSRYSSPHSLTDAEQLATNLGIRFEVIPIHPIHEAFENHLRPHFQGRPPDITEENIQARIRGNILMALSNKFGWLVLTTGNKSELAAGYCTLYGDMAGGFAVLKDVYKTWVYRLARYRNGIAPVIPERTLTRAPSAELRPDQRDEDALGPYAVLDPILQAYVEEDRSLEEIVALGYEEDTVRRVIRMVDGAEYKRRQGAPGIRITPRAFGKDRRLPITNRYRP